MPESGRGLVLYGISNCDQVRRARRWLDQSGLPYLFHDFKRDGLAKSDLERWLRAADWESLLNRQSTTWRGLKEAQRPLTRLSAVNAMLLHPTLIKRPVLERGPTLLIGFSEAAYARLVPPSHDH